MTDDPVVPPISDKPLVSKWQFVVLVVLVVVGGFYSVRGFQKGSENSAKQSTVQEVLEGVKVTNDRRDCVTALSTARTAVFLNVDIYKAILIQAASDRSLFNKTFTPEEMATLRDTDTALSMALIEAARLRPPQTLTDLIDHGGMVDGVHYDKCPA